MLAATSPGSRSASLKSPEVPARMKPTMKTSAAIAPASSGESSSHSQPAACAAYLRAMTRIVQGRERISSRRDPVNMPFMHQHRRDRS